MRTFKLVVLALGIAMLASAGVGADYILQKEKAAGAHDRQAYIDGLFDRVGTPASILGRMLRTSRGIDLAMPDPPAGWQSQHVTDTHLIAVFSDEQWRARARKIATVLAQVPELNSPSGTDRSQFDSYVDDISTAYTRGDNVILFYVYDGNAAAHRPVLAKTLALIQAHFDGIAATRDWRNINGQMWQEVEDLITRSENGLRPHRLRQFETRFGSVTLRIEARAAEDAMVQFLEGFDLSGLRVLSSEDAPVVSAQLSDAGHGTHMSLRPRMRPGDLQRR
ncbi:MAG: hypothetical protein AAF601_10660 [Pseudomonadota bacterium]